MNRFEGTSPLFTVQPWDRTTADLAGHRARRRPNAAPTGRSRGATVGVLALSVAAGLVLPVGAAAADPSATTWRRLRVCESGDNYRTDTGNAHYGAYQFDVATWRSVGGSGLPSDASSGEQDARALILYRLRGWQPWQCAGILGLQEDSDAGSGYIGDIHVPTGPGGGTGGTQTTQVPVFPGGSHYYVLGETNAHIKTFQDRMHARGYFPVGTGEFGPHTLAMVKALQRLNGLTPTGRIGPLTWRLAWTGRYSVPPAPQKPAPSKPAPTRPTAPKFPGGSHYYVYGETNAHIKTFQDRMHARGYFPVGTGEFGPHTLAMVKQLQRLNDLTPTGRIGPLTWRLAWTGRYHA